MDWSWQLLAAFRWTALLGLAFYGSKRGNLTYWIMLSMFIGAEIGYDFPAFGVQLNVLSMIFMKLIKAVIAPLVIGTLVVGIAGHSDMKQVGRMGIKALIYFEVVTTLALIIGLFAINWTQAGAGIIQPANMKADLPQVAPQNWQDILLHSFPENIAKSIADGQVLQVVVFAIIFSIGLLMLHEDKRRPMLDFCESLSETMFKFTNVIMYFAPFGVAGAMAYTI
ncbi:MAG: cation:dicarboxylase symporter family transporter, partial [Saprospiraceae bacterium]